MGTRSGTSPRCISISVQIPIILILTLVSIASAGEEDDDFEVLRGVVRNELYESACEKAVEFLRKYPTADRAPNAWLMLGAARFHTGRYEKALKALAEVRKSKKAPLLLQDVLYWEGETLFEQGKNDEAIDTFHTLLKKYPRARHAADAMYALGWAQAGAGRMKEAAAAFQKLLEKHPSFRNSDLASFKVGKWLYDMERPEEAIEELESFSRRYPGSTYIDDAWYWAAESRFELGQWKDARVDYEQAIKTSKDPLLITYSQYGLGWTLAENGKPKEALEILGGLLRADIPKDLFFSTTFRAAGIFFSEKDYERAADLYSELLDDKLYGNRSRFSLAECRYYTKQYQEAIKTYGTVSLDEHELTADVLARIGWCYFNLGGYDKAKEGFEKVIALVKDPEGRAEARARLADILFSQRQYSAAVEEYTRALEDGPAQTQKEHILYWLGWSHYKDEKYEKAAASFHRFLKKCSGSKLFYKAMERLARSYFMMEKFDDAAEIYLGMLEEKDLEKDLKHAALYQIGECYFNAGDYTDAIRQFSDIVKAVPGTDLAKQALYRKAMCLQGLERFEEANDALRSFLRRHPDHELAASAALLSANNIYKLSKFAEAARAYRILISTYPDAEEIDDAYYRLGWCFYNLDNMPRSAEIWKEAIRANPQSRYRNEILLGVAEALWKQGRYEESGEIFEEIISADVPVELKQRAHASYGDFLQTGMKYARAVEQYSKALLGPNASIRAKAQFGIAESRYHGRDYKEALDAYTKVMDVHKQFENLVSKARFRTARCLAKLNRPDEAMAMCSRIIRKGVGNVEKAKDLLEELRKEK